MYFNHFYTTKLTVFFPDTYAANIGKPVINGVLVFSLWTGINTKKVKPNGMVSPHYRQEFYSPELKSIYTMLLPSFPPMVYRKQSPHVHYTWVPPIHRNHYGYRSVWENNHLQTQLWFIPDRDNFSCVSCFLI